MGKNSFAKLIGSLALLCAVCAANAQWVIAEEDAPYNPPMTEERANELQKEVHIQPPMGPIDDPHKPVTPGYSSDPDGAAELAKMHGVDAHQALSEAENMVAAEKSRKPWLMAVVGLSCALLALGLVWWLRNWSDKNSPPLRETRISMDD